MKHRSRRGAVNRRAYKSRLGTLIWPTIPIVAGAIAVLAVLRSQPLTKAIENSGIIRTTVPASQDVALYFADPRWTRLTLEVRNIGALRNKTDLIKALVKELAAGPRESGAVALPVDAKLRNAYLADDGLAVLDFESGLESYQPGGASGELLLLGSVVQTIVQNVQGVEKVQFLLAGKEIETFAGHIKTSEPIKPNPELLNGSTQRSPFDGNGVE